MAFNNKETTEARKDALKDITEQLEKGITDMMNSDDFKKYLTTMSRFHNYSLNNTILIAMQKPDATLVAGFTTWKNKFSRNVIKGEKGIKILAPAPYKTKVPQPVLDENGKPVFDEKGEEKKEWVPVQVPAFKVVNVFDVSQTDGEPLPSIGVDELSGNVEEYNNIKDALINISQVPMEFIEINSGAKGYFSPSEQKICIQVGMSEAQTLKTMIHELAHSLLHDKEHQRVEGLENTADKSRNNKEVEAESVAFTVCSYLGLDTSDYSFGYIAGWSSDKELSDLKESLNTIRTTANKVINDIENFLYDRTIDKDLVNQLSNEKNEIKDKPSFTKDNLKNDLAEKKAAEKDAPVKPGHEKKREQIL